MATNLPPPSGSPPQSVEKITQIAQDYEYNPSVPLRYWLRTAATLVREVSGASPAIFSNISLLTEIGGLNRLTFTNEKDMTSRPIYFCSDTPSWYWSTWLVIPMPKMKQTARP